MNDRMDLFYKLLKEEGLLRAIQDVIYSPDIAYDEVHSRHPLFMYILNYIDASIYGTTFQSFLTNAALESVFNPNEALRAQFPLIDLLINFEKTLYAQIGLQVGVAINNEEKKHLSYDWFEEDAEKILAHLEKDVPPFYKSIYEGIITLAKGWRAFKLEKQAFATLIYPKVNLYVPRPLYQFRYLLEINEIKIPSINAFPVVFLEPLSGDFSSLRDLFKEIPVLFIFETFSKFFQMMQYPEVIEMLSLKHHLIYILDQFPAEQFAAQDQATIQIFASSNALEKIFVSKRELIDQAWPALEAALKLSLKQDNQKYPEDDKTLYEVAKRLVFALQAARFGIQRAPALAECLGNRNWHDTHKTKELTGIFAQPDYKDYMRDKLHQLTHMRHKREFNPGNKIKIVHIVPQIARVGHAPTLLLENIIRYHNRDLYESIVIVTERMIIRPVEYPSSEWTSYSSEKYLDRIATLESLGAEVRVLNRISTYEETATLVSAFMSMLKTDIAIFHGPDVINMMCAQITDVPIRVMFEHGTQPMYKGFDYLIVSSDYALNKYGETFKKLGSIPYVLPFAIEDISNNRDFPITLESLGIPNDALVMTTISGNLDSRLNPEMCRAIAEILKRVPKAYYVPIGPTKNEKNFMSLFKELGVSDRVVFIGGVDYPSQYAKCMKLYLNEFPFGSCMGILDAMTAGCPVVTMYDEKGPQQGRYGGVFFGLERAITTNKTEDYIELACRLLTNPKMYAEWSQFTLDQVKKYTDVPRYVKKFEEIIQDMIDSERGG